MGEAALALTSTATAGGAAPASADMALAMAFVAGSVRLLRDNGAAATTAGLQALAPPGCKLLLRWLVGSYAAVVETARGSATQAEEGEAEAEGAELAELWILTAGIMCSLFEAPAGRGGSGGSAKDAKDRAALVARLFQAGAAEAKKAFTTAKAAAEKECEAAADDGDGNDDDDEEEAVTPVGAARVLLALAEHLN